MHAHPLTPLPHSLGVQFVLPHTLLSMGLILECGWYTQCHFIEENWYPLSHQVSVAIGLLAKSVILCRTSFSFFFCIYLFLPELPFLYVVICCSSLISCSSFVYCHNLWVHMCIRPVLSGRLSFLDIMDQFPPDIAAFPPSRLKGSPSLVNSSLIKI